MANVGDGGQNYCRVYPKKHSGKKPGRPKGAHDKHRRAHKTPSTAASRAYGSKISANRAHHKRRRHHTTRPPASIGSFVMNQHHKGKPGRPRKHPCSRA